MLLLAGTFRVRVPVQPFNLIAPKIIAVPASTDLILREIPSFKGLDIKLTSVRSEAHILVAAFHDISADGLFPLVCNSAEDRHYRG